MTVKVMTIKHLLTLIVFLTFSLQSRPHNQFLQLLEELSKCSSEDIKMVADDTETLMAMRTILKPSIRKAQKKSQDKLQSYLNTIQANPDMVTIYTVLIQ